MDQRPPVAPIRAITSNLHARSPPSVPRANATYEPQIRNVLRLRLVREIMPRAVACVWIIESFWAYLNLPSARRQGFLGLLAIPFRPTTLAMTFVTWMFVVVPVLLSRRDGLSATPTPAASPAQLIKTAYARPVTRARLVLYLVAGFSFFLMQQAAANLCRPTEEIYLNVFVKSKKHPLYFNGRFLYTFFSQIFLGGVFFARNVLLDRWVVKWKVSPGRGAQRTVAVAIASLFIAVLSLSAFTLLFGLTRALVLPILLNFPVVRSVFRPFAAHFIRGRWTLFLILSPKNIAHVLRTFVINLSFAFALEFAEALFDEHVARPIALAPSSADPGVTLVSGATSPNSFYKYFAMHELRDFASDPAEGTSAARTALFGDQKHNPTLWATFVRDALMVLGADYQLLLRRGKPAPPPVMPAPLPAPEKAKLPEIPATPLQRGKIFKSTTQSPVNAALDALAADGAITQAVETSAERLPAVFQATHVPLLANSRPALPAPSAIVPVPSLSPGAGVGAMVMRRMPGSVRDGIERLREWWTAERLSRVAERSLPNRELDALTIDTLSYFICASLTEDRYGVVQRDIPRALEALVSFLTALETYHAELLAAMPPSPDEPGLSTSERASRAYRVEEISKARDVLMVVEDALKNGIMRIVQTFGARMAAFKFPSRTAEKLQEFVSYVQLSGHEDGKYAPGVALQVEAW